MFPSPEQTDRKSRLKKLLLVLAGALVGTIIFVTAILCLSYLTSFSGVTIHVINDSTSDFHNVIVSAPGEPDSFPRTISQGQVSYYPESVRMEFVFRIRFDAEGQHYDIPLRVRLFPIGFWSVRVHVDAHLQPSITIKGTLRA